MQPVTNMPKYKSDTFAGALQSILKTSGSAYFIKYSLLFYQSSRVSSTYCSLVLLWMLQKLAHLR